MRLGRALEAPGDDGWQRIVATLHLSKLLDEERSWGWWDELRHDLRRPEAWLAWLLFVGGVTVGFVLRQPWLLGAGALVGFVYFSVLEGRVGLARRRKVVQLPVASLKGPDLFGQGRAIVRPVGGRLDTIAVSVPWRACKTLIDRYGAVEVMALVDNVTGIGLALRPTVPTASARSAAVPE